MKLHLITPSHKMPSWIKEGYETFSKRLPPECALQLIELPPIKRHKTQSREKMLAEEYQLIQRYIPAQSHIVALDERGELWDTATLAKQLNEWKIHAKSVSLLIGGPDGLSPDCLAQAHQRWSLSRLTFPHGVVRLIVAEQIYRACTLLAGHPYHRE